LREVTSIPGVSIAANANHALRSEELVAYEVGARFRAKERVSFDLALFYNRYARLRTSELQPASFLPLAQLLNPALGTPKFPLELITQESDRMRGETHGGELSVNAQVVSGWRVRATYSLINFNLHAEAGSSDVATAATTRGLTPQQQATFWSQHDFGAWQFDWRVRYVGRLTAVAIPAYTEADARLAWRPAERWEFALAGTNLLNPSHPEFVPLNIITQSTAVPRRAYLEARYAY